MKPGRKMNRGTFAAIVIAFATLPVAAFAAFTGAVMPFLYSFGILVIATAVVGLAWRRGQARENPQA